MKLLFDKYQDLICKFANTNVGRKYLGINCECHVGKVTPNSYHLIEIATKKEILVKATIFSGSPYIKKLGPALLAIERMSRMVKFAKIFSDRQLLELLIPNHLGLTTLPLIGLTTTTFNPDANPESTSVDGFVYTSGACLSWAAIRSSASDLFVSDGAASGIVVRSRECAAPNTDKWDIMNKGVLLFDASSIADDATKDSATFQVYVNSKTNSDLQSVGLVDSTPASDDGLVAADYNQLGTTRQATDLTIAGISTTAYNTWTLNATGLASISLTAVTKFGLRLSGDIDNSAPTWVDAGDTYINIDFAEGTNIPKLNVTYTVPSTGAIFFGTNF